MTSRSHDGPTSVIIEAAINGQTTAETNPHVPRSSAELTSDALACLEAGAAIIHSHITDITVPAERAAALYREHFEPVLEKREDAILYPTIGFSGPSGTVQESMAHFPILVRGCGIRVGIIDPGSVNLGSVGDDGLPAAIDFAYTNTPAAIRYQVELCEELALGPSLAIFEPGFLRHALAYERAGRLPRGCLIKFYMGGEYGYMGPGRRGLGFGLPPEPWALDVYLRMLEEGGGAHLPWSVGVLGGDVLEGELARHALRQGGHLHLGLEDYAGPEQPSNVEIVRAAVALCDEVGRPIATPSEAAKILHLPR